MSAHLSLVPREYSEPAPEIRLDGMAGIIRSAHEMELTAQLLEAESLSDPRIALQAAPFIARVADAVARLQALLDQDGEAAPALRLAP